MYMGTQPHEAGTRSSPPALPCLHQEYAAEASIKRGTEKRRLMFRTQEYSIAKSIVSMRKQQCSGIFGTVKNLNSTGHSLVGLSVCSGETCVD
jgi:hypothetical protein